MLWTVHLEGGPRRVNHAAAAVDDFVYSFGGYCTGDNYRDPSPMDGYVLDTRTNRWSQLPLPRLDDGVFDPSGDWPYQRYGHTVCARGPLIYLFGGRSDTLMSSQVHVFDTRTRAWSKLPTEGAFPPARDGHSSCIVDGKMYVFGGYVENMDRFGNTVYQLDLDARVWRLMFVDGEPPAFRDFHTATAVRDRMYVFGGRCVRPGRWPMELQDQGNEYYSNVLTYMDTTSWRWVTPSVNSAVQPIGRRSHSAVNRDGNLLIFGGYNSKDGGHKGDVWLYDVSEQTWQELRPKGYGPAPRRRQGMCISGSRLFLFGGTSPYDGPPIKYTARQFELMPVEWRDGDTKLIDHSDMFVLDFAPTLRTICLVQVAKGGSSSLEAIDRLEIPPNLRCELRNMLARNSISKPLETLTSG